SPRRDRRGAIAAARPSGSAASVSATGATPSRNTIDPVPFFIADLAPNPWADVVRNRDRACERELFDARPPAEPKEIYRADPTALARAAPRRRGMWPAALNPFWPPRPMAPCLLNL